VLARLTATTTAAHGSLENVREFTHED